MSLKIINKLKKDGFFVIQNYISKLDCEEYETILDKLEKRKRKKNEKYFNDCINKGQVVLRDLICYDSKFLDLLSNKKILKLIFKIFEDQFIIDGVTGSRPLKLSKKHPKPHIDSHLPVNKFQNTLDIVLQLCVNDFNEKNGATYFWKKSHLSGKKCQSQNVNFKLFKKKQLKLKKGSLIIFLGQTWHQLGKNYSGDKRWGVLFHLKRWWIKPSTNYSAFFSNQFSKFTNEQKMLLGFSSISPKPFSKRLKTKIELKSLPKRYNKII